MALYHINTKNIKAAAQTLNAGDTVYLSGIVYTSRDAAHKRIFGPTPTPKGLAIGSCGPTTSSRMDVFSPKLLDMGLGAMIGKGPRSDEVCKAIVRNGSVYFCAVGGAGALASKCIKSCEVIAFSELGCESVKKLEFCEFPLTVAIDCHGGNLFKQ